MRGHLEQILAPIAFATTDYAWSPPTPSRSHRAFGPSRVVGAGDVEGIARAGCRDLDVQRPWRRR